MRTSLLFEEALTVFANTCKLFSGIHIDVTIAEHACHHVLKKVSKLSTRLKPGLHIVVTVAEHACDHVLKRVLKPSTHRLQIFLVKYEYLRSLQPCEDHGVS